MVWAGLTGISPEAIGAPRWSSPGTTLPRPRSLGCSRSLPARFLGPRFFGHDPAPEEQGTRGQQDRVHRDTRVRVRGDDGCRGWRNRLLGHVLFLKVGIERFQPCIAPTAVAGPVVLHGRLCWRGSGN